MPNAHCSDPFKTHKKHSITDLRPASTAAKATGLVSDGDLLCSHCRKDILVPEKVEAQKQENAASSESPDGPYAGSDLATGESSGDESASQSSDEIFDADTARSVLNVALPALGESPIKKRSISGRQKMLKIQKKMKVVQKGLEVSYGAELPGDETGSRMNERY